MGYSNKEIAMATGLKENTVKSYRKKLKSITGYRSVSALEKMLRGKGQL
jgi:DNA-binding CsgD family transcriptional regulator